MATYLVDPGRVSGRGTGTRPPAPARINRQSPMAYGLELGLVMMGGPQTSPSFDRGRWTANGAIGSRWIGPSGNGADFSASTTYFSAAYADAPFISSAGMTIIWRGVVDTGSDYRHFAGKHDGSGAANNPFDFRTDNSATPVLTLVRSNATLPRSWAGQAVTLGSFKTYAVRCADNVITNAPDFFVDGSRTTGSDVGGTGSGVVTGTDAAIRVGSRADSFLYMDGYGADVWFFNRAISDDQIALFSRPTMMWDLDAVPSRRVFFDIAAAGGGGPIIGESRLLGGLVRGRLAA